MADAPPVEGLLWCPLCDWTTESDVARMMHPDNLAAAPGVAAVFGMPTAALLATHEHQCRQRDERTLGHHLATHDPVDWAPELMAGRRVTNAVESLLAEFADPERRRHVTLTSIELVLRDAVEVSHG